MAGKKDKGVVRPLSPTQKNKRGQIIHKRERVIFVNLYKDLKTENPRITEREAYAIISKRTGYGASSIKCTLLHHKRTGGIVSPNKTKHRTTVNQFVDEFVRNAIRKKVHGLYVNNVWPTLRKVLVAVNNDENLPDFKRTNFWKLLKELNFTFVSCQRKSILTEKDDLVLWRRRYLKSVRKFREEGRPIYYLDETWVNAGDVCSKVWTATSVKTKKNAFLQGLTTGASNPSGKGKRLVVLHIGSTAGFVPGGLLCFKSQKTAAEYQDEMDAETFLEWFEKVLPTLKENAVIVMDNAPCHSAKSEKIPDISWKKKDIVKWLESKGKAADMSLLKVELLHQVSLIKDECDTYVVDEKAKAHNKTVLRLPPYHCELNPMEMAWSMVKGHVKTNNLTFKINDVKKLFEEGVERVTAENWASFVKHVTQEEAKFWQIDEIADRMMDDMEPSASNANADSDSDTNASD